MLTFAQRLIAEERKAGLASESDGRVAFRVCEKLRRPLVTFAGVGGYRSLVSRALVLARAEEPWLAGVKLNPDGIFQFTAEIEAEVDLKPAGKGATAVVAQLLGLLVTFIGEALTLRLVQDVWPKAAISESNSGGMGHEKKN